MRDIDQIIESIRNIFPAVKVRQLNVSHPGDDDDGIWFLEQADSEFEVQIESPQGMCPFLIETDESSACYTTNSIEETVETVAKLLHVKPVG